MKKMIARGIAVCLFMSWLFPYIKNEFLTFSYGNEFIGLYESTNMIDHVDYLKVLSYSDTFARVYYVGGSGDILEFTRINEKWERVSWVTVWSQSGSADNFIWPYFYHSPEGVGFFVIVIIFITLFLNICLYAIKIIK